jgi:hypothetical protein
MHTCAPFSCLRFRHLGSVVGTVRQVFLHSDLNKGPRTRNTLHRTRSLDSSLRNACPCGSQVPTVVPPETRPLTGSLEGERHTYIQHPCVVRSVGGVTHNSSVYFFWSDRISLQELDLSFSTVFFFLQTDTVVRRMDARKICLVRKS